LKLFANNGSSLGLSRLVVGEKLFFSPPFCVGGNCLFPSLGNIFTAAHGADNENVNKLIFVENCHRIRGTAHSNWKIENNAIS
jgi:hypothetical protein